MEVTPVKLRFTAQAKAPVINKGLNKENLLITRL